MINNYPQIIKNYRKIIIHLIGDFDFIASIHGYEQPSIRFSDNNCDDTSIELLNESREIQRLTRLTFHQIPFRILLSKCFSLDLMDPLRLIKLLALQLLKRKDRVVGHFAMKWEVIVIICYQTQRGGSIRLLSTALYMLVALIQMIWAISYKDFWKNDWRFYVKIIEIKRADV